MSNAEHPIFNDRYEVSSRIGRGGMADVFLARDRLLDRPVAVKVLFPEYASDPNFVERFRREAQSAANLTHPNIVGVYDWGRQGSTYFIVMEYVNGRSLAEILRSDGALHPQRAAEIANEVAAALSLAHSAGMVHRDIKPGNILVSPSGSVKVADFGIARAVNAPAEHELTQAGAVMGTATYFSPEQAQGATPDPRSDLYSLGIVMYELVAGHPPFAGENPVAIAYKQVHETPRPLSDVAPGVTPSYEAITMRLLAKQPANRYSTAEELRLDLRRFREGAPLKVIDPWAEAAPARSFEASQPITPAAGTQMVPSSPSTQIQPRQSAPSPAPRLATTQAGPTPARTVPTYPVEPAPRRTGWYVAAALLTVVLLGIAGLAVSKILGRESAQVEVRQVAVPSVLTLTKEQAEQEIKARVLVAEGTPELNEKVAVGQVWDQSPKADTPVDENTTVKFKYNPGKSTKNLPKLADKTLDEAKKELAAAGIALDSVREQASDDKPVGTVIGTEPPAGEISPTAKVIIIVSTGKAKVKLPNVATFDQARATTDLSALGLKIKVEERPSDTIEKGKVVGTEPPAGSEVTTDEVVKLIISAGNTPGDVPNVVGKTEAEATNALFAADFQRVVVLVDVANGSPQDGKVIAQSPVAGKQPKKSVVTITVGKALPATTTTTSSTTTTTTTTTTTVPPAPTGSISGPAVMFIGEKKPFTASVTGSGILGVQFKLNGPTGTNLGAEVTSAPYTVEWTAAAPLGTRTIVAIVRTASGTTTLPPFTTTVIP